MVDGKPFENYLKWIDACKKTKAKIEPNKLTNQTNQTSRDRFVDGLMTSRSDPRMAQYFLHRRTIIRVRLEQLRDEFLHLVVDGAVNVVTIRHHIDHMHQRLVVDVEEREVARQHHVQDDAERPDIHCLVVRWTEQCLGGGKRHVAPIEERMVGEIVIRTEGDDVGQVRELRRIPVAVLPQQDIVGMQVAYDISLVVDVADDGDKGMEDILGSLRRQRRFVLLPIDEVFQPPGIHIIQYLITRSINQSKIITQEKRREEYRTKNRLVSVMKIARRAGKDSCTRSANTYVSCTAYRSG